MDPITVAVVQAAQDVPGAQLLSGATAIEDLAGWSPRAGALLVDAVPASPHERHAKLISQAWSQSPDVPGRVVAASIRTAVAARRAFRQPSPTVVWTGPVPRGSPFRTTRAVLHTLVADAAESLLLVSFAGYNVDDLVTRLADAVRRGVDVTLVLEGPGHPGGGLSVDAANAFAALAGQASLYRWPLDQRVAFHSASASLHAKCVVADKSRALVTSANLTGAGINDNMELGLLVESGPLPATLHEHFADLMAEGYLARHDL